MQITYIVHSATPCPIQIEAQFQGQTIPATVNGLVVELLSDDGTMTHTLRFGPEQVAEAEALYPEGAPIQADFVVRL